MWEEIWIMTKQSETSLVSDLEKENVPYKKPQELFVLKNQPKALRACWRHDPLENFRRKGCREAGRDRGLSFRGRFQSMLQRGSNKYK